MENDKINLWPLRHPCLPFIWPRTEEWSATASFFSAEAADETLTLSSPPSSLVLKSPAPTAESPFSITAHPQPQPSGRLPVWVLNTAATDQHNQSWQGIAPHADWNISKNDDESAAVRPLPSKQDIEPRSEGQRAEGVIDRLWQFDWTDSEARRRSETRTSELPTTKTTQQRSSLNFKSSPRAGY